MTEPSVKIVRLQSGEDIIAGYLVDDESEMVMLDNPMHLIFKRTPRGTVMMMMPWLPIELIKDNMATIYTTDILTVVEPKEMLIEYYGNLINHEQLKAIRDSTLQENLQDRIDDMNDDDDELDVDEYDEPEELTKEDMEEIMSLKRKGRLH
jgi:hypothetical protein